MNFVLKYVLFPALLVKGIMIIALTTLSSLSHADVVGQIWECAQATVKYEAVKLRADEATSKRMDHIQRTGEVKNEHFVGDLFLRVRERRAKREMKKDCVI
jgi:hypothetical protein